MTRLSAGRRRQKMIWTKARLTSARRRGLQTMRMMARRVGRPMAIRNSSREHRKPKGHRLASHLRTIFMTP